MKQKNTTERPPIVVVLGHVDHGKSTLLDYIRKSKTTEAETGGITQHIGAYEIEVESKRITFIDTPGHAAFSKMRARGAAVADIAILVVAADDGVKPQTIEAIEAIKKSDLPFIIAITKMDKTGSSTDKAKQSLAEAGLFVEGYGGNVSMVPVSGKTGEGIPELLSLILLSASLLELTTDINKDAEGVVIESHRDQKNGSVATLIVKDGTLKKGSYVLSGQVLSPVRSLQNFLGKMTPSATASSPILVSGWTDLPEVGEIFRAYEDKRTAEKASEGIISQISSRKSDLGGEESEKETIIPIVLKADVAGTLEAIEGELRKRETENISIKLVGKDVGNITEGDVRLVLGTENPLIVGFNVSVDRHAGDLAEKNSVPIMLFDIIYKLTEWFDEYVVKMSPKEINETITGEAKILKTFSRSHDRQVIGGKVLAGKLEKGKKARISRQGEVENEIVGEGKIVNLQRNKSDVDAVSTNEQFGAILESKCAVTEGDIIQIVVNS